MSSCFFTILRGQGMADMAVLRWVVPLAVPWHRSVARPMGHGSMLQTSFRVPFQKWLCGEDQSKKTSMFFFGIAFQSFPTITRDWYSISSWGRSSSDFLEPIPSPFGTEACFSHTSESSGDLRIHDDMTRFAPVKQLSKSAFKHFKCSFHLFLWIRPLWCVRIRSAAVYVSAKLYDVYDLFVGSPKKPSDSEGYWRYWRYWYEDLF